VAHLLHHLLEQRERAIPAKQAVVSGTRRLSYADFAGAARTAAAALAAQGMARGDRVAIYLDKSFEEAASIFGVSMAGGVFVPVNALLKPAQVAHILADCQARYVITTHARWQSLAALCADLALERVFLIDAEPAHDPRVAPQLFAHERPFSAEREGIGEDLAAILYTSGSTGRPKGVMLSHRNLLAGSRIVRSYLGITAEERILSILPFSFDYGLNQLITTVDAGATIVLLSFRFGDEIVRAIVDERITGLAGVPSVWALLTQGSRSFHQANLDGLRYISNSGGAVPTETVRRLRERLPSTEIFLMYGLTEAFRSTYLPPSEIDLRPTSIGKAIPETEIFLLSPSGQRCKPGEQGVLVHRGPTVSMGYWNRPEDTARVLRRNPLLGEHEGADIVCYSGDLATMDEDGFFYFVARNDAMIKSAGYRISPTEVEEVLMATRQLALAAVIGLPDPTLGERVHAVVVPAGGAEVDKAALLAHCVQQLPAYMVPRDVELVAELPRSPNLKIDYGRLRAERCQ
jgi:acyl-CoA ligase (AMP-forming) (exosortase A-associated)